MVFILLIFSALLLGGVYLLLKKFGSREEKKDDQSLLMLQGRIGEIERTLNARLQESSQMVQAQLGSSQSIVKDVTERLAKFEETNRQVVSIADQLKGLQDILKNPKQRGVLGEYFLETVLKNVLPPGTFAMQHSFKNGDIVDAVVFVKDKIIPIDSKFSLENYNRFVQANESERPAFEKTFVNDLKLRIQETAKYIRPDEGTMEFAFMFIPSEGIYYALLTNQVGGGEDENLIQRAAGKYKVIIVSPTSFLAYLQTVLQGLRALHIEEEAKDIIKRLGELGKHWKAYEDYMNRLGVTLNTTVNHYNTAYKELGKIDKDVLRITGEKVGFEPMSLDGPKQGD